MPESLEIIWHPHGVAYAFLRNGDGTFSADVGIGDADELEVLGIDVPASVLSTAELVAWRPTRELGDSANVLLAIRDLAERSVGEGLVHPELTQGGGRWYAFWGATLDQSIEEALAGLGAALPAVSAEYFHGDRMAVVDDVYPRLVDQIARDRLVAAGVKLTEPSQLIRSRALEHFLDGLVSPDPELPAGPTYTSLAKRITKWVDEGLGRIVEAPWTLGLHLDERVPGGALTLELWLHAEDDPTLALPAKLLWESGADPFAFLRDTDPYEDLASRFEQLGPFLAEHGIELDEDEPSEAELSKEDATYFLRELLPQLEHRGIPVLLPSAWVQAPKRIRANLTARAPSGLLSSEAIAEFDWRLAVGDVDLDEEELTRLAKLKSPVVHAGGRWHALRHEDVTRALRFLERRAAGGGVVELVRGVSGLDTDEYGLELGEVAIDEKLAGMLDGDARFKPMPTPPGMEFALFQFQEQGHGWLRLLGDLGIGAILADDMGLGKTVQAIAMLVSERAELGADALGPTLVVCPMSVARQWVAEIERFAPGLRVHLHHGNERLAGEELARAARASDVVVTSYDIVTRDLESLQLVAWDRAIMDEAQDVKNPQTKRARSLRLLRARRRVAMTGTPIENHLGELWALMDLLNPGLLGPREWYTRTFAHPIQAEKNDEALERLRGIVRPFILRRAKDDPEVELDLPPITVTKDYCRLTVEQASLYQATVDNWMPRVEAHEDRFGRRGAVLAMLGHLKQVCNHPEMLVSTGLPLDGRSGKLERLVELLGDVPQGDKALVFTQYTRFSSLVPHLEERLGKEAAFFHGHLNGRQRNDLLTAFAGEAGPEILVISLRAGGRGLYLPAANHVFHFDRWWNPAVEQQATDRVHRLGQRKPVFVHSLICLGTLEERIDQLLESKRELVDKVMAASGEEWLGSLDLGAIRAAVALAPDAAELVTA
ncbi:MAG: DEAD/DEAH box helicase [Thermoleophilia bacterium]|nr:DEAD/DEAH box helicase [Thermoleophilia bacterium]